MATKYRAIRRCFHLGHYYGIGALLRPTAEQLKDPKKIPRHFVEEKDFSEDKVDDAAKEDIVARKVNIKVSNKADKD